MQMRKWMLLGLVVSGVAFAADGPKVGKWEYNSTMKMDGGPQMPQMQLPPGVQLPPGMQMPQMGPQGMSMKFTRCITKDDMVPKNDQGKEKCTVTKMDQKGNTVNWAVSCDTPQGKAQGEGTATYTGDSMTSVMTTTINDKDMGKIKMTQNMTGRYLGACQ
ncbi:MAG TPA: DUF3617 family protein [Solimonas sp.]|nr:DUF3617 family protein [Solimonas sp.]